MSTKELLKMKKWAVIGATNDESKFGNKIYKKLKKFGYEVYPISPKYETIDGDKAYKQLEDLPIKPDVVNFVVNPKIGFSIISKCRELDINNVWMQPGTVDDELLKLAEKESLNLVQACVLVELDRI